MQEVCLGFLDCFDLWNDLVESFCGHIFKGLGNQQEDGSCGFGMVDTGV